MIKYIGSKRTLLKTIVGVIRALPDVETVIDLFSGTSRVGHALKGAGFRVRANDHNAYAHTIARCYVQTDRESVEEDARRLIGELNHIPGKPGYFTETFCVKSRFFKPNNGERIDAIRERVVQLDLAPELESVLLVSLMEAADRVDSTTGLQMAYLKQWAARAHNDLHLRTPDVLAAVPAGKCVATCLDAKEAAAQLEGDVAYIDPPYNQHSYLGNYHIWESLVRWDKPEVYGIACKRIDCRERKSPFNSRVRFREAFTDLIQSVRAPVLVVSFNDEGYLSREDLISILSRRGEVLVLERDYRRYVGAQIGIHNLKGEKVGRVSHLRNKEYVCVAGPPDRIAMLDEARETPHEQAMLF